MPKISNVTLSYNRKLSELTTKFSENVMDASDNWSKLLTSEDDLAGLPPMSLAAAKQMAEMKGEEGWLVTLDFPSYLGDYHLC